MTGAANREGESPMVQFAHAALIDSGRPDLCTHVYSPADDERPRIRTPCPDPHLVVQAVALSHRAAGHTVTVHRVPGAAGFDCIECGFEVEDRYRGVA